MTAETMTETEIYKIRSRFTDAVQFEARIEKVDKSCRFKLGLAVKAAIKQRANLRGADLGGADLEGAYLVGANLGGADLGGLILLGRHTRNDGYEYFAWTSVLGGMVIITGCRTWVGEDAVEQARKHCRTSTAEINRPQALRICDYIEADLNAHQERYNLKASA